MGAPQLAEVGTRKLEGRVAAIAARAALAALAAAASGYAVAEEVEAPPGTEIVPHDPSVFGSDPAYEDLEYDFQRQLDIYGGKYSVQTPRPMLELGRELYTAGPFQPEQNFLGDLNPVAQSFYIYGDWRTALAFNDNGKNEIGQVATRLNLDMDYRITATERIHAFIGPLDQGGQFDRCEFFGPDENDCDISADGNFDALFFEGDLGAITAGVTGEYQSWDLPFAFGLMPLLFQNGIWVEDAFTGVAATIPAMNSPTLDISNMDITFFAGFDKVTTPGIKDAFGKAADHGVNVYGVTAFIETMRGYWEVGYGYSDADDGLSNQSYHNVTAAFSKRYGGWLSNSVRVIGNFGQDANAFGQKNADGVMLLVENSLITELPSTLIPYANFFLGIDKPQSLARAAGAGGILKNTGINFETDGLTGFPKLDDTGNDAFGGALGIQYLFNFDQQIVAEFATVQAIGGKNNPDRVAKGDEYAVGLRYQLPLDKAWILRADAMHGWRVRDDNLFGARLEIRRKF